MNTSSIAFAFGLSFLNFGFEDSLVVAACE